MMRPIHDSVGAGEADRGQRRRAFGGLPIAEAWSASEAAKRTSTSCHTSLTLCLTKPRDSKRLMEGAFSSEILACRFAGRRGKPSKPAG